MAVRRFFSEHDGDIVAKLQHPFVWRTAPGAMPRRLYTTRIEERHLERDRAISDCPVIYQRTLDYLYELRVTCFGRCAFAVKQTVVNRTRYGDEVTDIRAEDPEHCVVEIPEELEKCCFRYMASLNLAFAAFDIAFCADGYHFIESNQSGQFLYLENRLPELPLFDAFCKFLASGDREYRYAGRRDLHLDDFERTDDAREIDARLRDLKNGGAPAPYEIRE